MISFTVAGRPRPQGSKRHVGNGRLIEQSPHLRPWRQQVTAAAIKAAASANGFTTMRQPVAVDVRFRFIRPQSHYGTGRNACTLKAAAPAYPTSRQLGDTDKLARAVLDAITVAGIIGDDSQVVTLTAHKTWAVDQECVVCVQEVRAWDPEPAPATLTAHAPDSVPCCHVCGPELCDESRHPQGA